MSLPVRRQAASPAVRRRDGRARLLDELASRGTASRAELARATGLAPSTVTSLVASLMAEGVVRSVDGPGVDGPGVDGPGVDGPGAGGVGRPGQLLTLGRGAGVVVGVDLGRRHLKVAVADLSHSLLARREVAKPAGQEAAADIELIRTEFEAALAEAGVGRDEVVALGMGLPGPVHTTGELGDSTILPGWVGVRAADANLGALSESKWGAGAGVRDLVYLKASTGIGAGLIINGRLFRGAGHTAGELGHTVIDPGGPVCRCGNRGCLEMYAGSAAILSALRATHPDVADLAGAVGRAHTGDPGCRRVVADAGRAIGSALATLCNIVNPARVIVGGTLGEAGELLLEPMRASLQAGAIRSAAEDVEIVRPSLGHDAELMGAIALALERAELRV